MGTPPHRARYCRPRPSRARPRPDDRPRCPSCGRGLQWGTSPDGTGLVGRCTNPWCYQLVSCRLREGQWRIVERFPAAGRALGDGWPVPEPAR
jgi:hypothetical protein